MRVACRGSSRSPLASASARFDQRLSSRRARTILGTSSGPAARRSMRLKRHIGASGVSSVMPRDPWIWIARSRTFITMFAATILIAEIDWRAGRLPSVSLFPAGLGGGKQAGLADFDAALGDVLLDELLVGQRAAEGDAFVGAAAHHLVGPLGGPDRPHAVVDAPRPESVLGGRESRAAL